jgi:hypothetical protein
MAAQTCKAVFRSEGAAAASASERARQSVNRAPERVEEKLAEHDPALGAICSRSRREHVALLPHPQLSQQTSVRTGCTALCSPFVRLIF